MALINYNDPIKPPDEQATLRVQDYTANNPSNLTQNNGFAGTTIKRGTDGKFYFTNMTKVDVPETTKASQPNNIAPNGFIKVQEKNYNNKSFIDNKQLVQGGTKINYSGMKEIKDPELLNQLFTSGKISKNGFNPIPGEKPNEIYDAQSVYHDAPSTEDLSTYKKTYGKQYNPDYVSLYKLLDTKNVPEQAKGNGLINYNTPDTNRQNRPDPYDVYWKNKKSLNNSQ
jgi:hypothetical protein